jgi:acetyl esterase
MEAIGSSNPLASMKSIERRAIKITDTTVTIPIQIYVPNADGSLPVVLLMPSVDFVAGDLVTHDRIARTLAAETPAIVVLPQTGLPPETDWQTALHQLESVLNWIPAHISRWQGRTDCIILIGEGSGGAQAAALSLRQPDEIRLAILIHPILDLRQSAWEQPPWYIQAVAPNDRYAELISPLARESIDNAPRTYIITDSEDPAREHGALWSARLSENEIPVQHRTVSDQGAMGLRWILVKDNVYQIVLDIGREIRGVCDDDS